MLREGMEGWMVVLFICTTVALAMIGVGWSQWLEHKRRSQAMDLIKAALEAGKEPPAILYEQIARDGQDGGQSKPPWSEVVVFSFLGFGFWIAYANAEASAKTAFLIVAASMTVTALGCLALAIMRPHGRDKDDDAA